MRLLAAWIGTADLRAPELNDESDIGPIAQALRARAFGRVLLLTDQEAACVRQFETWLRKRTPTPIEIESVRLSGPTNFGDLPKAAVSALDRQFTSTKDKPDLTFISAPARQLWPRSGSSSVKRGMRPS